jgi:DNA invertase Pin-like site-specific DNA recombinase
MRRRPEASLPDLFEVRAHSAGGQATDRTTPTSVLLPSNLESSLAILSDDEFARLHAGVTAEAARRKNAVRSPKPTQAALAHASNSSKSKPASRSLSTAKANLVRAAIKAGVKPSAIARQFGVSKAEISEVLRSEET